MYAAIRQGKAKAGMAEELTRRIKEGAIPIISDVAGEVAGGIQKMINAASKTLLYEFRVTGTTKKPKIETVPAPALTDGVAKVFGAMMKGQNLGDLKNLKGAAVTGPGLDEPAQLLKMPRLMSSKRQCFTVSPLEPAMN